MQSKLAVCRCTLCMATCRKRLEQCRKHRCSRVHARLLMETWDVLLLEAMQKLQAGEQLAGDQLEWTWPRVGRKKKRNWSLHAGSRVWPREKCYVWAPAWTCCPRGESKPTGGLLARQADAWHWALMTGLPRASFWAWPSFHGLLFGLQKSYNGLTWAQQKGLIGLYD